jgi:TRAP-type mannitol/chloroaromatic compound transport system permease large subunit
MTHDREVGVVTSDGTVATVTPPAPVITVHAGTLARCLAVMDG